jgi:hypothetical protein
MPSTVIKYLETEDYLEVFKEQRYLIEDYRSDVSKHTPYNERNKTLECYDKVHLQLLKEFSKFQYSLISKNKGKREYQNPLN